MKVTRALALAVPVSFSLLSAGCGWLLGEDGFIKDRREEYREARVIEPLKLPAEADSRTIRQLYEVPGADRPRVFDSDEFEVPRPDSDVAMAPADVRAFQSGNSYWIVLDGTPGEVWGRARRFWEVNDIALAKEVPQQGLMETAWLKRTADGQQYRDKFRLRVEHGLQADASEIYVSHLGYAADSPTMPADPVDWSQARADDPLAVAMVQELASFLIRTQSETAPASLLAQRFQGEPKAALNVDSGGEWVIDLRLGYARAWDAVGKAIESAGLTLQDQDRDSGHYYLLASSALGQAELDDDGFFSFMPFTGDDEAEAVEWPITLKLMRHEDKIRLLIEAYDPQVSAELRKAVIGSIKKHLI